MHITERNGSFRITISCGRDDNGKQILRTATFTPPKGLSKRQAQRAVNEFAEDFERKVKGGANIKYTKMTFKSFCYDLYFKNHLTTLKPKTASGYRIVAETRLIPYFGDMLIRNITPLDIRGWLSSLERNDGQDKPLSRNSTGSWFRTLSAILGKAYEWELIEENPCKRVKSPAKSQSDVQALQLEDVQKVIDKLPEYDNVRARVFIQLLLYTGIREAEAAGLEWRDIDFENRTVSIRRTSQYIPGKGMIQSTPKSESSFRILPVSDDMMKDLILFRKWQVEEMSKLGPLYEGKRGNDARLFTTLTGRPVYDSTLRKW